MSDIGHRVRSPDRDLEGAGQNLGGELDGGLADGGPTLADGDVALADSDVPNREGEIERPRAAVPGAEPSRAIRVAQLFSSLAPLREPQEILDRAARELTDWFDSDGCAFLMRATDSAVGAPLTLAAHWGIPLGDLPATIDDPPASVTSIDSIQPVCGSAEELGVPAWLRPSRPRHLAWARLMLGGEPLGFLVLARCGGEAFNPGDRDDLGLVSSGITLAVENGRLCNLTEEQAQRLQRLSRSVQRSVPLAARRRQSPAGRGGRRWPRPPARPRRTLAKENAVNLRAWCDAWTREAERSISGTAGRTVHRILAMAREQLKMDLVWLSRFINGRYVFQAFAGDPTQFELSLDSEIALSDTYCIRVLDGRLASIVPDALADERTANLPITRRLRLGAYAGAPVFARRGEQYGMLCAVSRAPEPSLRHRDARLLRTLAGVLSESLSAALARDVQASAFVRNAESMLDGGGMTVHLQPIVDLRTGDVASVEALARFSNYPYSVEGWFAQAHEAGCGPEMEIDAVVNAQRLLGPLPEPLSLAINATPDVACSEALLDLVTATDPSRVVVEITEQRRSSDPSIFAPAIRRLKSHGVRVAIDDAGTGYSDLRHIVELQPDIVKLDRALINGVHTDPVKAALVQALVAFAKDTGIQLVAEGISSLPIRDALRGLNVDYGQGYALGPPEPSDVVIDRLTR